MKVGTGMRRLRNGLIAAVIAIGMTGGSAAAVTEPEDPYSPWFCNTFPWLCR